MRITQDMFEKLEYDKCPKSSITPAELPEQKMSQPTVLLIFNQSDIYSAAYHLNQYMQNPLSIDAVTTILVQESIIEDFLAKIQEDIPYELTDNRKEDYLKALQRVGQFNAKTIRLGNNGPIVVYDLTHQQLGFDTRYIITLQAFRTTKEAISLCHKQGLTFRNASIWSENYARAYEIVEALNCKNFFINCFNVSMEYLSSHIEKKTSFVTMKNNYHYETIANSNGVQKSVVFPYGTIFAN